jgi:hypothetical protein
LGSSAPLGRLGGLAHQPDQASDGIHPVSFLAAESPRFQNQNSRVGNTPASQPQEALANRVGQRRGVGRVEAQLHGRGHFIDVLAPRTGGAHKPEHKLTRVQR